MKERKVEYLKRRTRGCSLGKACQKNCFKNNLYTHRVKKMTENVKVTTHEADKVEATLKTAKLDIKRFYVKEQSWCATKAPLC
jgi:hypothetical protein